jgi:hypothetical protein
MRVYRGGVSMWSLLWVATALGIASAAPTRPNVLVLFADDLGFNQLSLPGQPLGYTGVNGAIKTPHLAQFASEGTTFVQWYSGFHVCTPSRAALTGRLPVRVGLGDGVLSASAVGGLQHNETTMAEALGAAGYATAMFGKVCAAVIRACFSLTLPPPLRSGIWVSAKCTCRTTVGSLSTLASPSAATWAARHGTDRTPWIRTHAAITPSSHRPSPC